MIRRFLLVSAIVGGFTMECDVIAQERYGAWEVSAGSDSGLVSVSTTNQDGNILMRTCGVEADVCSRVFTVNLTCKDGDEYPALGNSNAGASHLNLRCGGKIKNDHMMQFTDFDDAESLLNSSGIAGIAFPLESGRFSVVRFSLDGLERAAAAQIRKIEAMRSASTRSLRL